MKGARNSKTIALTVALMTVVVGCGGTKDGTGGTGGTGGSGPGKSLTHGAFKATVVGASSVSNLMEIELAISNLPKFAGVMGEYVEVRGQGIYLSKTDGPYDWIQDKAKGMIGNDLSTTIKFFQNLTAAGQNNTDFLVYRLHSRFPVTVDKSATTTDPPGCIQLDLLSIAKNGDKVRIEVDASNSGAAASVPVLTTAVAVVEPVLDTPGAVAEWIEIELNITNIPEANGPMLLPVGREVVVRGFYVVADAGSKPGASWSGESILASISASRSVTFNFFQAAPSATVEQGADFKIFLKNTWDDVFIDGTQPDGNIRLDLWSIASRGQKVRITIDASNPKAMPVPHIVTDGPFSIQRDFQNNSGSDMIEVYMTVNNIPAGLTTPNELLSLRGEGLWNNVVVPQQFYWSGDLIQAVVESNHSATFNFLLDLKVPLIFKIYRNGTNDEVFVDRNHVTNDRKIVLDISVIAKDKNMLFRGTLDASNTRALAVAPQLVQGAFTVLPSATANTLCPGQIEQVLAITKIPDFAGPVDSRVVVRGANIMNLNGAGCGGSDEVCNWNGDGIGGPITGVNRDTTITFCSKLCQSGDVVPSSKTDYKIFDEFNWNAIVRDNKGSGTDNIQLDLGRVVDCGGRVEITVDASSADASAPSPTNTDGPFKLEYVSVGANTLCSDLLEVEMVLQNIPGTRVAAGGVIEVRGAGLYIDNTTVIPDWAGDAANAPKGTVQADGSAVITFCQNFAYGGTTQTNLRVFKSITNDLTEVVRDNNQTDGNLKFNLLDFGFLTAKVRLTVDANDARTTPP